MTIVVPIGADCGVSFFCKKFDLRRCSLPFDWTVSYNGVSRCFDRDFQGFTEPLDDARINNDDVYFHHDFAGGTSAVTSHDDDHGKYARRCARLVHLLRTTTECVVFCRKGHSARHHDEHRGRFATITSDLDDCAKLHRVISCKYPTLRFKIVVFLMCGACFAPGVAYESPHEHMEVFNLAKAGVYDHHADYATFEEGAIPRLVGACSNNQDRGLVADQSQQRK